MIYPSLQNILKIVGDRYTLVIATAKRARQLAEGSTKRTNCRSDKPVTIAINEINEHKITFERKK